MTKVKVHKLIDGALGATTSAPFDGVVNENRVINAQAIIKGTGAVAADVVIEGSNDGENYQLIATLALTGTDTDSKSTLITAPWAFIRADIAEAPTGTDASVSVVLAI